jgi:hypothetical protein
VAVPAGVAHDIVDDTLAGLEFCNAHTCANTAFPCVLYRADDGTDVLVQQRYPIEMLVRAPGYFAAMLNVLPVYAQRVRADLAADTALGGTGYRWPEDADRLLRRSLL